MCDPKPPEGLSQELLRVEQSLLNFEPTSTLSRDEVIFAAGKASVGESQSSETPAAPVAVVDPQLQVSPVWRVAAVSLAGLSVVLALALTQIRSPYEAPQVVGNRGAGTDRNRVVGTDRVLGIDRDGMREAAVNPSSASMPAMDSGPDDQQPRSLHNAEARTLQRLMAAVRETTSRRDLAIALNRRNPYPIRTTRREPNADDTTPPSPSSATRATLLKEFLP